MISSESRKKIWKRSRGMCEAGLPGCRFSEGMEIHHLKSRSLGGSDNPINLIHLCWSCHRWVTDKKAGWERFRTASWQEEGKRLSDSEGK